MKPIFILAFHSLLVLLKVNAKRDDEEHGIGIPLELNEDLLNNAVIEGLIETNLLRCIHGSPPVDLDPRVFPYFFQTRSIYILQNSSALIL